uniref:Gag-Pol polyprotein n=1 Tax=Tanacetum cinerariifolium TaxID=118510 RepID=A0A699GLW5_TANCI|nr:Gag-Pol polyprotein [Tanacetum cinerariifolium]
MYLVFYLLKILQICLWILDSGCSKHMTGNRALLTNFVEKFFRTVWFANNDFAVIAGYEDVVIVPITIKKVYYVECLGHNLFSVGQFCDKGLEVAFRKSTCFVRIKDGVNLLTDDRVWNLYTIVLNDTASNSSNFTTINNSVKNNLVRGIPKIIIQQFSAARIPQQNGDVERMNRTLVKAARTMLTFDHPLHKIIGDSESSVRIKGKIANSCSLSNIEPANVAEALKDVVWVNSLQDELDQFARIKVWRLVPRPKGKTIINTKWIFKNKKDESSLVIRNKARLVAIGYCQQEGIDYDETFAPIA